MTPTLNDGETAMAQCPEPSVDDMVDDPIVRALMAADGVDPPQLRRLLRSIAESLRLRRVESPRVPSRFLAVVRNGFVWCLPRRSRSRDVG
jgi:hypothetical protein